MQIGGSDIKKSACNSGDEGSILGLGRSLGEGSGNPEKPMDRGAWWATVQGVTKSQTRLSKKHFVYGVRGYSDFISDLPSSFVYLRSNPLAECLAYGRYSKGAS